MRNQVSLKFLLLLLVGLAQANPGSLRTEPLPDPNEIIMRALEDGNNDTDASDWFGGSGGNEVAPSSSKNETEVPEGEAVAKSEPPTQSPAVPGNAPGSSLGGMDTNSTGPEPAGTENPENWDTTPETQTPTGEGDDVVGDDLTGGDGENGGGEDEFGGGGDSFGKGDDEFAGDDEFEGDDEFAGDDVFDGDDYEDIEGEGEWGEFEPEDQGTKAPYIPPTGDDPFANGGTEEQEIEKEWHPDADTNRPPETMEEMAHDQNVIIAISCAAIFGVVLAVCSVQQVIENPDGCCASLCRCSVKFFCFFFKILCFPCRMCCGNKDRRTHDLMIGSSDSYTHDLELT